MLIERSGLTPGEAAEVLALVSRIEAATGRSPINEDGRLWTAAGGAEPGARHLLIRSGPSAGDDTNPLVGYGYSRPDGATGAITAEVATSSAPHAREIIDALLSTGSGEVAMWVHGEADPAAAIAAGLAADGHLVVSRELRLLRRPLGAPSGEPTPDVPDGVTIRPFVVGQDEEAWLAVNRAAFVELPDQGTWTMADLELRLAEPWFRPDDLLLATREADGELLGFHWTKVVPADDGTAEGEVYVLAVAPEGRGMGLGHALALAGITHLADRGCESVALFVDASNSAALRLYARLGFRDVDRDVRYVSAVG